MAAGKRPVLECLRPRRDVLSKTTKRIRGNHQRAARAQADRAGPSASFESFRSWRLNRRAYLTSEGSSLGARLVASRRMNNVVVSHRLSAHDEALPL